MVRKTVARPTDGTVAVRSSMVNGEREAAMASSTARRGAVERNPISSSRLVAASAKLTSRSYGWALRRVNAECVLMIGGLTGPVPPAVHLDAALLLQQVEVTLDR